MLAILAVAMIPPALAESLEGDVARGRTLYKKCQGCHPLKPGKHNSWGPNLHGVIGRKAGSAEGYGYSDALQAADFIWTAERLEEFLRDPKAYLPGVTMVLKPLPDAQARADIIAYITAASSRD